MHSLFKLSVFFPLHLQTCSFFFALLCTNIHSTQPLPRSAQPYISIMLIYISVSIIDIHHHVIAFQNTFPFDHGLIALGHPIPEVSRHSIMMTSVQPDSNLEPSFASISQDGTRR